MEATDVNKNSSGGEIEEYMPIETANGDSTTEIHSSNGSLREKPESIPSEGFSAAGKAHEDEITGRQVPADQVDQHEDCMEDQGLSNDETKIASETIKYITPLENPYEKAWKYLFKHDILSLFQGITADIAAVLPDDPIEHMINAIEDIQEKDRRRKGIATNENSATNVQEVAGGATGKEDETLADTGSKQQIKPSESGLDKTEDNENVTNAATTNDSMKIIQGKSVEGIEDKSRDRISDDTEAVDNDQGKNSKDTVDEVQAETVVDTGDKSPGDSDVGDKIPSEGDIGDKIEREAERETTDTVQDNAEEEARDDEQSDMGADSNMAEASDNPAEQSNEETLDTENNDPNACEESNADSNKSEPTESSKDDTIDGTVAYTRDETTDETGS